MTAAAVLWHLRGVGVLRVLCPSRPPQSRISPPGSLPPDHVHPNGAESGKLRGGALPPQSTQIPSCLPLDEARDPRAAASRSPHPLPRLSPEHGPQKNVRELRFLPRSGDSATLHGKWEVPCTACLSRLPRCPLPKPSQSGDHAQPPGENDPAPPAPSAAEGLIWKARTAWNYGSLAHC